MVWLRRMTNFRLRIKYSKKGRLRWLSHLELVHAQERMIRRAGLPYAISQGFNPHMKLAFGPALPVGCGSFGEYLEVWLTHYFEPTSVLKKLQDVSASELLPTTAQYVQQGAPSLIEEFVLFDYEAVVDVSTPMPLSVKQIEEAIGALMDRGYIEVLRKKKLKRIVLEDVIAQVPHVIAQGNALATVAFSLRAVDSGSLRPDVLLNEIGTFAGGELLLRDLTRVNLRKSLP
jgi:radical SAM-linked protein